MIPTLVAILNLTPDSFSDGGSKTLPEAALAFMESAIADGARVIDIGAESTRPGATLLSSQEEWSRLQPVLPLLIERQDAYRKQNIPVELSLDTRHPHSAGRALDLGVQWINDVGGFQDSEMVAAVRGSLARCVVMHSLTVPADPSITLPAGCNAADEVRRWAVGRIIALENAGISKRRLILDPGIGFGKTPRQSWDILAAIHTLRELGVPLLVGHSRKSFLKTITQAPPEERDMETRTISLSLAQRGVSYLRVHDISGHSRSLRTLKQLADA